MAEPWIGESAVIEWRKAMSSTQVARCGNNRGPTGRIGRTAAKFHARLDDPPLVLVSAAAERFDFDDLVVAALHLRLIIKRIDVARPAVHVEKDHALRFGGQVRRPGGQRIGPGRDAVGGHGLPGEETIVLPNSAASAVPVNPAPVCQRNSRRVRPQKFRGVRWLLMVALARSICSLVQSRYTNSFRL